MKHIAINGQRGVGKTTLITRLIRDTGLSVSGFMTRKEPMPGEVNEQIFIHRASTPLTERQYELRNRIGICGAARMLEKRTDVFETLGVEYLSDCPPGKLIVMDELGFLEAEATRFQEAVIKRFDGDIPVIAAIKYNQTPFLDAIRNHPKVEVFNIDFDNRDALYKELLPLLRWLFP